MPRMNVRKKLGSFVNDLSDPTLDFQRDREDVNRLVLNLVMGYMAEYLNMEMARISDVRNEIARRVQECEELVDSERARYLMGKSIPGDELFPLECAADIPATAALVKEIIFNDGFERGDSFCAVDLGSGTGILSLAAYIAGRRAEVEKILVVAGEMQSSAVVKSRKALNAVDPDAFRVQRVDITAPSLMQAFDDVPLSFLISETINSDVPECWVVANRLYFSDDYILDRYRKEHRFSDPFPDVMMNVSKNRPTFVRDVLDGRTALFPDVINGLYIPDDSRRATLQLKTGMSGMHLLSNVGQEFRKYSRYLVPTASRRFPK